MSRLQQNLAIAQEPAVRKYLDMLAAAEGADYGTLFGGEVTQDFSDHPRQRKGFTQTDGKKNVSSAAGRYQFLEKTWDGLKGSLGLPDFSPQSQDAAAIELLRQSGSLKDVQAGNYQAAVGKDNKTWASLPGSPYAQKTRTPDFIAKALGGQVPKGASNAPKAVPSEPVVAEVATPQAVEETPVAPVTVAEAPPMATPVQAGPNPWDEFRAMQQAQVDQTNMAEWGAVPQFAMPNFLGSIQQAQPRQINFNPFGSWGRA